MRIRVGVAVLVTARFVFGVTSLDAPNADAGRRFLRTPAGRRVLDEAIRDGAVEIGILLGQRHAGAALGASHWDAIAKDGFDSPPTPVGTGGGRLADVIAAQRELRGVVSLREDRDALLRGRGVLLVGRVLQLIRRVGDDEADRGGCSQRDLAQPDTAGRGEIVEKRTERLLPGEMSTLTRALTGIPSALQRTALSAQFPASLDGRCSAIVYVPAGRSSNVGAAVTWVSGAVVVAVAVPSDGPETSKRNVPTPPLVTFARANAAGGG